MPCCWLYGPLVLHEGLNNSCDSRAGIAASTHVPSALNTPLLVQPLRHLCQHRQHRGNHRNGLHSLRQRPVAQR